MNKSVYFVLALLSLFLSGCASGPNPKDKHVTIDDKNIAVADFDELFISSSKKLKSSELNNGVYIIATCVCCSNPRFINAEKVIGSVFKAHGIKIADSLVTSSKRISFTTTGALDLARADQAAAYSAWPNSGQVASGGGQMIGAVMNGARSAAGGVGGLVGFAVGALWNSDSKLGLVASVSNPANGNDFFTKVVSIYYRLEKGKEAADDVVLKMAIEQWVSNFVVFDTTPGIPVSAVPSPAPVFAVATAENMDERK